MTKSYLSAIALLLCFCGALYAQPRPGQTPIDWAKVKCAEIGFTAGTEKFGGCVLQLLKDAPREQATEPVAVAEPKLAVGSIIKDCADCPEMVVLPAGSFEMGSNEYAHELPMHRVNVPSFLIGKTEVTQGQWKAVMGSNPSYFGSCGDDCPVEQVSWNDAQAFVRRLSQKTGKQYRLPSEAEWEYAARAGSTKWSFGGNKSQLGDYAWIMANSQGKTQRVAQKRPNAFGLFDMHGNVWEWVQDCWHGDYSGAPKDGSAWTTGCRDNWRVLRGVSWNYWPAVADSGNRYGGPPGIRNRDSGLRLARPPDAAAERANKAEQEMRAAEEAQKAAQRASTERLAAEAAQRLAAARLAELPKPGQTIKDCADCPEMVVLPAGSFEMGSPPNPLPDPFSNAAVKTIGSANEKPQHRVQIKSFAIGKYEVTQEQWYAVMGANPSINKGRTLPVEQVSWNDTQVFIQKLNQKTGQQYRLPSEAEWEYAARAGAVDPVRVENPKAAEVQAVTVGLLGNVPPTELKSEEGKNVGPLAFSVEYPSDWVEGSAVSQRLKMLLAAEGNAADPAFAFQKKEQGGIVYGTWTSWPVGNTFFTAQKYESMVFTVPPTWGIEPGNIKSKLTKGEYLEAAHLELTGKGDGSKFIPGGAQSTVLVWAALPLTFMRNGRVECGMATVSYIGTESDYVEGKLVLESILRKIKPNGVEQMTEQEFFAQLEPPSGNKKPLSVNNAALPAVTSGQAEYSFGDDENELGRYAWYSANSGTRTHPVGEKQANRFGLYDMHGNVSERVQDCWHDNYTGAPTDGSAWTTGCSSISRVLRGGSWGDDPASLRSASRGRNTPDYRNGGIGLRLARTLVTP